MSIRIGIYGYGNLARGVEAAIRQNPDMELAAVFTRRDPASVKIRTAGVPVLDTIRKSGVTDAVVVVTRYFGGILLGAGGLVRAYSHTAKLALEAAHIITYEQYTELELVCSYSDYQRYQAELPRFGAVIDDTQFSDRVNLLFAVKSTVVDDLCRRVREMSGGKDMPALRGTRFDYR